jgi:hypothetical protein
MDPHRVAFRDTLVRLIDIIRRYDITAIDLDRLWYDSSGALFAWQVDASVDDDPRTLVALLNFHAVPYDVSVNSLFSSVAHIEYIDTHSVWVDDDLRIEPFGMVIFSVPQMLADEGDIFHVVTIP